MAVHSNFKEDVIKILSEQYTADLLNFEKCKALRKCIENNIQDIKTKLDLGSPESTISKSISQVNAMVTEINKTCNRTTNVIEDVSTHLQEADHIRNQLNCYFEKLVVLESTLQYIKILEEVEKLCDDLQRERERKDDEQSVTIFANISEIARQLTSFSGSNLHSYIMDTLLEQHKLLKERFVRNFNDELKAIKWPFISANFSLDIPLEVHRRKLQIIVEYLLQIDLPEELVPPSELIASLPDFPRLCLPIHLLIEPLRKRFLYHFHGNRQTNRVDKPEWYFTKILSWIRDHAEFVEKFVQPVVDKMGFHHIDTKIELMRGLVQLAVEKLYTDLPALQYDDFTFSHCIDEALAFDKELKETYEYPNSQPGILVVLTQGQVFIKWMNMEKKYALEKMDIMLSDSLSNVFQPIDSDLDDLRITPCAEMFITLLQTITERYELLPQPGHRLQFLQLQLDLLDDFRVRLLQLVHAEEDDDDIDTRIAMIANTIFYIETILLDWGTMLNFLNLHYYKNQCQNSDTSTKVISSSELEDYSVNEIESDSVFNETLSLYRHMRKDLMFTLAESVIALAKARCRRYIGEMWSKITVPNDIRALSLTSSACPFFEVLAAKLHHLQKNLTGKLCTMIWRSLARQIDSFLFDELVLENRFSEGGALQFKYDITRNLFPLFSQFTHKPETYFTQLSEACILLNLAKGSALLLKDTLVALKGATGVEDRRPQTLKEVGVQSFSPKMVVLILNRRADITIGRIIVD